MKVLATLAIGCIDWQKGTSMNVFVSNTLAELFGDAELSSHRKSQSKLLIETPATSIVF